MSFRIVYENEEGGVSIVIPAPEFNGTAEDLAKSLELTVYSVKKPDEIPSDRTFRNAWTAKLSVDMPKAREILKDKMRVARAPLLAALDVEYQRADEVADVALKKQIVDKKQALRDVTKISAISTAKTPDQLKAAWPEALGVLHV